VIDFMFVLFELFRQLSRLRCYERILVEIVVFERGRVTLNTNFRGKGASPANDCWRQKTRVPGLSRGVVCVILRIELGNNYESLPHTIYRINDYNWSGEMRGYGHIMP